MSDIFIYYLLAFLTYTVFIIIFYLTTPNVKHYVIKLIILLIVYIMFLIASVHYKPWSLL